MESLDLEVQQKEASNTDHSRISLGKEQRGKLSPASPRGPVTPISFSVCSRQKCNPRMGGGRLRGKKEGGMKGREGGAHHASTDTDGPSQ